MKQLKDEKNDNKFKEKDKNVKKEENEEKKILENNALYFLMCLTELKEKVINIIKLTEQLKNQYDFICINYPNLLDIVLSYQKSFFFLHLIAETEIINNIELSRHYILRRINIILEKINALENKNSLDADKIKEMKNLREKVKELYLCYERNNNNFREKMNTFLEFLNKISLLENNGEDCKKDTKK